MPCPFEIVAVDDCSRDGSRQILQELAATDERIKAVLHNENAGKGAAIHTAIANMSGDIAIVQDADLEYDPNEIPKVIAPILEGKADACFGSRYAGRENRRVLYYRHTVMNKTLTWLTNIVTDLDLTDMETCYKAVRADILKQTPLKMKRFGIEPELSVRLAQWGARIYEVPISYSGRTYAEGKKITWKDGLQAVTTIFWAAYIDRKFTTHDGYFHEKAIRGPKINHWVFEKIKPFVGQNIVEAGSGLGNLTELMLSRESLICFDKDPLYVEQIRRRFSHLENFDAYRANLETVSLTDLQMKQPADTILCLNVLEYLSNDISGLQNLSNLLQPGGNLIVMVPQHQWLYGSLDKHFGHVKRYEKSDLADKLAEVGLEVRRLDDFNRLGALGWFACTKLLKSEVLPKSAMSFYNLVLPIAKWLDSLSILPAASIVAVARKPTAETSACFSGGAGNRQTIQVK